jgi:Tol biopolymer transport system component
MKGKHTRRESILVLALLAVLAAVGVGALVSKADATGPGANGKIAFRRYFNDAHTWGAIFVSNADGTGPRQVTRPPRDVFDDYPDWSPNGSSLVFQRSGRPYAIYTVKPDGSGLTRVSPPCSASGPDLETKCEDGAAASFLPDGRHVVYTRSTGKVRHFPGWDQIEHSDIVVRDVDGANPRVLVRSRPFGGDQLSPQFSPDGSRFVYERVNSPLSKPPRQRALFVVNADGSRQRRITPWGLNAGDGADWSPDGTRILFRSQLDTGRQSQLYTIRPDGSRLRQLTSFRRGTLLLSASFSPDGQRIVFSKAGRRGKADVFVMRADGTNIWPITRTALWDSAPDWGPR